MKRPKRFKWLLFVLLTFYGLFIVAYVCRASLLLGLANEWIVNEPLSRADVMVVSGGGPDTRPFEAARFFQRQAVVPGLILNRADPSARSYYYKYSKYDSPANGVAVGTGS